MWLWNAIPLLPQPSAEVLATKNPSSFKRRTGDSGRPTQPYLENTRSGLHSPSEWERQPAALSQCACSLAPPARSRKGERSRPRPVLAGASALAAILASGKGGVRGRSCRVGAGAEEEERGRRPRRGGAGTACLPGCGSGSR